jgi:hypothetical protein
MDNYSTEGQNEFGIMVGEIVIICSQSHLHHNLNREVVLR